MVYEKVNNFLCMSPELGDLTSGTIQHHLCLHDGESRRWRNSALTQMLTCLRTYKNEEDQNLCNRQDTHW